MTCFEFRNFGVGFLVIVLILQAIGIFASRAERDGNYYFAVRLLTQRIHYPHATIQTT